MIDLMEACVALLNRGTCLGARYSAGRYTPAVPAAHAWAVLDLQGAPVALCHDLFQAAQILCWLESGEAQEDHYRDEDGTPYLALTEAERAAQDTEERMARWGLTRWCPECGRYVSRFEQHPQHYECTGF